MLGFRFPKDSGTDTGPGPTTDLPQVSRELCALLEETTRGVELRPAQPCFGKLDTTLRAHSLASISCSQNKLTPFGQQLFVKSSQVRTFIIVVSLILSGSQNSVDCYLSALGQFARDETTELGCLIRSWADQNHWINCPQCLC